MFLEQFLFRTEHCQWGAGDAEPCKGGSTEQEVTTEL